MQKTQISFALSLLVLAAVVVITSVPPAVGQPTPVPFDEQIAPAAPMIEPLPMLTAKS